MNSLSRLAPNIGRAVRDLSLEIFTEDELKSCTVLGVNSKGFGRSGLPKERLAILQFVNRKFVRNIKWPIYGHLVILDNFKIYSGKYVVINAKNAMEVVFNTFLYFYFQNTFFSKVSNFLDLRHFKS